MAAKGKEAAPVAKTGSMKTAELLACVGYMTDVMPSGSFCHAWRVALAAEHLAATLAPQIQRDVFYAGLLHDIGAVGAYKHITRYVFAREQNDDVHIKSHAQRGAALVNWLPGMGAAAAFVRSHHEWWDGTGYPDGLLGHLTPLGAQIVGIVSVADTVGCFRAKSSLRDCLPLMSVFTGRAWTSEMWAAFVRATAENEFFTTLVEPEALPDMIMAKIAELPLPSELDNEEGVERVFHLIAALVDLKDPSTNGHSLRTARRAEQLARYLKLSPEVARVAYRAGLVHDCGRLGVDTRILIKSGRLNDQEMDIVRRHAQMTVRALSCLPDCAGLIELGEIAGHDHERFDGNGYPDGLKSEDIPQISRILSVVDAFDSMIAAAHYRLLTPKGAVVRIEQSAGSQFDPEIARAMVEAVSTGAMSDFAKMAA